MQALFQVVGWNVTLIGENVTKLSGEMALAEIEFSRVGAAVEEALLTIIIIQNSMGIKSLDFLQSCEHILTRNVAIVSVDTEVSVRGNDATLEDFLTHD